MNSSSRRGAIVVGDSTDEFIRYVMNLLGHFKVGYVLCDNVYSAVAELARHEGDNVLVIGRLEQLSKQQGRFFEKLNEKGLSCCCLAERNAIHKHKQILAAMQTQAYVINRPADIETVLAELSADSAAQPSEKQFGSKAQALTKDESPTAGKRSVSTNCLSARRENHIPPACKALRIADGSSSEIVTKAELDALLGISMYDIR